MACRATVIGTTRGMRGGVLLSSELVEGENPSNQTRSGPSGQQDHLSLGDTVGAASSVNHSGTVDRPEEQPLLARPGPRRRQRLWSTTHQKITDLDRRLSWLGDAAGAHADGGSDSEPSCMLAL